MKKSTLSTVSPDPTFASILRAARQRRGWTQTQLALYSGVSQGQVSQYESGRFIPKSARMKALGKALGKALKVKLENGS